jgi:hypothetical protein
LGAFEGEDPVAGALVLFGRKCSSNVPNPGSLIARTTPATWPTARQQVSTVELFTRDLTKTRRWVEPPGFLESLPKRRQPGLPLLGESVFVLHKNMGMNADIGQCGRQCPMAPRYGLLVFTTT